MTFDQITSTLWWWSGTNWHDVGNASTSGPNEKWIYATAYDACAPGTQHTWHTEAQADLYIGTIQIGLPTINSPNDTPLCFE